MGLQKNICYGILLLLFMPFVLGDSISGVVRNVSNNVALPGVRVEAWDTNDIQVANTTTDASGAYTLTGLTTGVTYLIRAYQIIPLSPINYGDCSADPLGYNGYMAKAASTAPPRTGFNFSLIRIPRKNIDYFTTSTLSTTFYGFATTFGGRILSKGDVVFSRDPQGVLNGMAVNCWDNDNGGEIRGGYSLDSWGDDADTTGIDEGAVTNDVISFYINNISATVLSGTNIWDRGAHNTELTTSGTGATCQLFPSNWSQPAAVIDTPVTINLDSQGCPNKLVNVTVYEGGIVSRGKAVSQPGVISLDGFGQAAVPWIAEWVNDAGGGDTNPPEYYFVAVLVENTSVRTNSSAYGTFLTTSPDVTPPGVSNVVVTPYGDNAIITWTSTENATSTVDYGPTASYGSTVTNSSLLLTHFIVLPHLNLQTIYYYRISSTDKYGNTNSSVTGSFTLPSPATIVLQQGSNGYTGVQDTYLYSQNNSDLGGLTDLKVGPRLNNGDYSWPLLQFSLSPLPSGATIVSATLNLTYSLPSEGTLPMNVSVYRILKYWKTGNGTDPTIPPDIGEVSWNYSEYNTKLWSVAGANGAGTDRETNAQSALLFDSSTPLGSERSWALNASMVQAWLNNGSLNYGIILRTINTNATRYRFWSSEYGLTSARPKLIVTFTKGPTCSLMFDANCNSCINGTELNNAIQAWYNDVINIPILMDHIKQWKLCSSP